LLQDDLVIDGHAIEVRLYAEDPGRGFLPSTGRLLHLALPTATPHLRVDSGVEQGDEVSVHYDPMIAKLIVWDRDRDGALRRLQGALRGAAIAGVASNLDFLSRVAAHPAFRAGDIHTGFIDRHLDELVPGSGAATERQLALAALDHLLALDESYRAGAAA